MPKLIVIAKGKPREIEMGQELTIGRGYSNLLRLEGEEISRVHAIIYRRDQGFILRDLDSKNGVFLNGSKIAFAELGPGDKLQVGKYRMVFNPPAGFDMEGFAGSPVSGNTTPESNGNGTSGRGIDASDADYSRSQMFTSKTPEFASAIIEAPKSASRDSEEVTLLTRLEIDEMLSASSGIFASEFENEPASNFNNFMRQISSSTSSDGFSQTALNALVKILSAHRGVIILRDGKSGNLRPAAIVPQNSDVAINRVVLKSAFSEMKAILCPSTLECGLFRDSSTIARENITTLISVPIISGEVIALLYLDRQGDSEPFSISDLASAIRITRLLELHLVDLGPHINFESQA